MKTTNSIDYLGSIKIKIYQRTMGIAIIVVAMLWSISASNGNLAGTESYIFPFSIFFCFVSLGLFRVYGIRYLKTFENSGFGFVFFYFLLQFVFQVITSIKNTDLDFQKFLLWMAILYTFAFLIFPPRQALQWSSLYILCIFVVGIYYYVVKQNSAMIEKDIILLIQIYGSGLTYVSLLYAIAKLKEKHTEAEIRSDIMSSLANTDMLTGALSRIRIEELLDFNIINIDNFKEPLTVLMLDLDEYKRVNDTYGHIAGDYVLRRTVEILRSNLRDNDSVGRYGGDEFLIICPNIDADRAAGVAQRLEKTVSNAEFENVGHISVSIGTATYQQGDTSKQLLKRADLQMYASKNRKRIV